MAKKIIMEGRNSRLVFSQNRVRLQYDFKNWSIKPNVTKHADPICGEDRDELSTTLNYYEISGQVFVRDAEIIRAYILAQKARDARTQPLPDEGAMRLNPNDGTRVSFIFVELKWDDWDLNSAGRADKKMCTLNYRCQDIK